MSEAVHDHTPVPKRRLLPGRQLLVYPERAERRRHLATVVVITVALYYALYVGSSVAPMIMRQFDMSFAQFVDILAVANLAGAFASLLAGLCDRFGRANLVVWGLLVVGALTSFAVPLATTRMSWAAITCCVGFVEGVILVATPALIRDFSPQIGRATAMGFWTIGPVLGSLLVSAVASATVTEQTDWRYQYEICGAVVLLVFALALFTLRELAPALRDQKIVSEHDRKLIELRATNLPIDASLRGPWRQMFSPDIVLSALGVSLLLLFYYTAVAFGVVFSVTMFGLSVDRANALADWGWSANAVALIAAGIASDRLRVRKPFMLVGALGALVTTILYRLQAGGHPDFTTLAVIVSVQAAFTGCAYATWMAAFTETIEARNPALTATGLAIWGWILRLVVTASFLLLPQIVTTMTDMVQAPVWIDALQRASDAKVAPSAEVIAHLMALRRSVALAPEQWRLWFSICSAGIAFFIVCTFLVKGRWNPRAGLRDQQAHERRVDAELRRLQVEARS